MEENKEEKIFVLYKIIIILFTISYFLFFLSSFLFSKYEAPLYFTKVSSLFIFLIAILSFVELILMIFTKNFFKKLLNSNKDKKFKLIYFFQVLTLPLLSIFLSIFFLFFENYFFNFFTHENSLTYLFFILSFLFFFLYNFFTKENIKYIIRILSYTFLIILLGVTNLLILQETDLNYFYFYQDTNFNCEKLVEKKLLGVDSSLNCYFKSSEDKKHYIYYIKDKEGRYLFTTENYFSLKFNNEIDSENNFYVYELNIQNYSNLKFNNSEDNYFYINKSNKDFSNIENLKVYINNETNITNRIIYSNDYIAKETHILYEIILISNKDYYLLKQEKYLNSRNILIGAFIFFFAFLIFLIEIAKVLKINLLIFKNKE